ncbi:Sulfite reductase [NADPH] hemoprotein beta-component [Neolecta irregularis DAH-3]|uniref:assimilatory sulfite reductase (NADPH) n=1 Tax=Neolecta irregularis (strain DAH-3) TaxID=1198029 RepID=A0A1U7LIS8_NEOID|nr:Sulfite reductase [NADPH] hemoprotein beta-component [Neolecta irregularis DAH-3]|eukprot:OLL22452.1 Sulfite reductase [NADPH] hemoprotein beta-component [Neolecta irregularis DAH-3]
MEPLYGPTYLPRKFKLGIAIPPSNDVDVYTNDVGFIAIVRDGNLSGFNVTIGGGMGMTHNNMKTYPRLGDLIGFVSPDQAIDVAEKIMLVQRDHGDRKNRKHARLKYTIDDHGVEWFVKEVEKRLNYDLKPAQPFSFDSNVDKFGWRRTEDGKYHFCMFIENGRVCDEARFSMKAGLREIASYFQHDEEFRFRLTANQHLYLCNISEGKLVDVKNLLAKWALDNLAHSGLRLSSSSCVLVALPTCGLAMAESERYLPLLVSKVENILEEEGLRHDSIVMRMTGCPNGCARPWVAEIAFVGKAPDTYNMYLGGGYYGQRLNKLFKASISEEQILESLKPLIKKYATERKYGERFGDWTIRAGVIQATLNGQDFHNGVAEDEE